MRLALFVTTLLALLAILASPGRARAAAAEADLPVATVVYQSDLDRQVEIGVWSSTRTTAAPKDQRRLLGDWGGRHQLVCTLDDLPEHRFIRLRFKLFILKTADGSGADHGPDTFSVMTRTGLRLLHATFCNQVETSRENPPPETQSFPDEYPYARYEAGRGALEMLDLGFHTGRPGRHQDSVYTMDFTFPHADSQLAVKFFSRFGNQRNDETWGIREIKIETINGPIPMVEDDFEALWKDLAGEDPVAANRAKWELVQGGRPAYRWIVDRLAAEVDDTKERYDELLPELEADRFKERRAAREAIIALGQPALPLIQQTLARTDLPETKSSLREVVAILEKKRQAGTVRRKVLVQSRIDHILHLFEAEERVARISTSLRKNLVNCFLGAANDGRVPKHSKDRTLPHCTWHPEKEGRHWLQYDFAQARELSQAEVYWFIDGDGNIPKSWEIHYQDEAGKWISVNAKGAYTTRPDSFNRVRFEPVVTKAVRLAVELSGSRASAVFEFRVGHEAKEKDEG